MAQDTKPKPLSRDREYLVSQIERGHDVLVGDTIYNKSNLAALPTQEDLDANKTAPATPAVVKPPTATGTTKPATVQTPGATPTVLK